MTSFVLITVLFVNKTERLAGRGGMGGNTSKDGETGNGGVVGLDNGTAGTAGTAGTGGADGLLGGATGGSKSCGVCATTRTTTMNTSNTTATQQTKAHITKMFHRPLLAAPEPCFTCGNAGSGRVSSFLDSSNNGSDESDVDACTSRRRTYCLEYVA